MALIPRFTKADVLKKLRADKDKIETAVINRLKFEGEKFVINARSTDTYKDRTGNLRSSIGYVIIKNGQQLFENFPGEVSEGKANGIKVAKEAIDRFPTGIVLIVVAGMGYAGILESRGYDVLTSSSFIAESSLTKSLNDLKNKIY